MLTEILKVSELHSDDYTKNINESSYIQRNIVQSEKYSDLTDMIISHNDPNYTLLPMSEKEFYLKQRRLEIGSEIEENKDIYPSYHFNNFLTLKKIQSGLMKKNSISSLFFLSEYYKVKIVLINEKENLYYETPRSFQTCLSIKRDGDSWVVGSIGKKYESCPLKNIEGLEKDIVSFDIYDIPLKPASSYKLPEIQELADKKGISIKDFGKNKTKKVLYEELRTYFLNLI